MSKKKVYFDAVATFLTDGYKDNPSDTKVTCSIIIDKLHFDDVVLNDAAYEYLKITEAKSKNRFWFMKSGKKIILAGLQAENGEINAPAKKSADWLYLIFVAGLLAIIPGAALSIAALTFLGTQEFYGIFVATYAAIFYLLNRRANKLLDLNTYTEGKPADIGRQVFGS